MGKATVYEIVTERILEELAKGVVPWRKPWAGGGGIATSLASGKEYRGVNQFLLGCAPYGAQYWLTYKQAKLKGGNVKKGSKGWPCIFWKMLKKDAKATGGKDEFYPILRYYTVFNVEQCEGIAYDKPEARPTANVIDAQAAKIAADWFESHKGPSLHHNENQAFYNPSSDGVNMPKLEVFESGAAYHSVLFHEMSHSTGHKDRLARKGITGLAAFGGGKEYGLEELVAEMGAAFLCAECGLDSDASELVEQSASYIDSWRRKISKDPKLVVQAAAKAQKSTDMILGRTWDDDK